MISWMYRWSVCFPEEISRNREDSDVETHVRIVKGTPPYSGHAKIVVEILGDPKLRKSPVEGKKKSKKKKGESLKKKEKLKEVVADPKPSPIEDLKLWKALKVKKKNSSPPPFQINSDDDVDTRDGASIGYDLSKALSSIFFFFEAS